MCDAQSVTTGDLVPQDLIYRDRTGEIYGLTYNPAHRWYYAPAMRADEALLLKCYELADRRAGALHAAYVVCPSECAGGCAAAGEYRVADIGFL